MKILLYIVFAANLISCNVIKSITKSETKIPDSFYSNVQEVQVPVVSIIALPTSATGVNPNPRVTLTNVSSGDNLRIFTDSNCATEVGTSVSTGGSSDVAVTSALVIGTYTFYANSQRGEVVSACSSTSTSYNLIDCPTGYIYVPGNTSLGVQDFCVMQYEASNSGGAVSDPSNAVWTTTSHDSAYTACSAVGANYSLIANPEWITLARNIESIGSNWSSGTVGIGCIFIGNVGDVSACSYDGADPENGVSRNAKAKHTLSSGKEVFDLGGNMREWVNWLIGTPQTLGPTSCASGATELNVLSCGALVADDFMPTDPTLTSTNGIGVFNGGTGGAAWRGDYYGSSSASSGIYNLSLGHGPSGAGGAWGFRCVYRP